MTKVTFWWVTTLFTKFLSKSFYKFHECVQCVGFSSSLSAFKHQGQMTMFPPFMSYSGRSPVLQRSIGRCRSVVLPWPFSTLGSRVGLRTRTNSFTYVFPVLIFVVPTFYFRRELRFRSPTENGFSMRTRPVTVTYGREGSGGGWLLERGLGTRFKPLLIDPRSGKLWNIQSNF